MRLDHLLSREKWLRRLNRILGRASGEARAEAEVRNSGEAPQNNRQKAGYDLTEFLIETLYRFEGSARFFKRTLKTAQGRLTERRSFGRLIKFNLPEKVYCLFFNVLLKSTLKNRVKAHKRLNNYNDNSKNYGLIAQMVRAHA